MPYYERAHIMSAFVGLERYADEIVSEAKLVNTAARNLKI